MNTRERGARHPREERFRGRIMGIGAESGLRAMVGMWHDSPLGAFTDVFLELPDGSSLLLAPDDQVATYVASTYRFDDVRVVPVRARRTATGVLLDAGPLLLEATIGPITLLGRLLRIVPPRVAVHPAWLTAINPVVRLLVRGAGTAGTAGGGRREYYGVFGSHAVTAVRGTWEGVDSGTLRRVDPPVRFGFASMPARPMIVDVETVIRS